MSTVTGLRGRAPSVSTDRLVASVPLAFAFLALVFLYLWQAHNHHTPWLFTDELELTQISRSIAETGHAARRGAPYSFHSLTTVLLAPAWLFGSTPTAYGIAKGIGVVVMAAVVFPAYGLARFVCSPRYALFAAVGAGAIPALAYSSLLLEEPLAYTWSTLCMFLGAKAIVTRSWRWITPAAAAAVLAPLVRGQLLAITAALVLATLWFIWTGERARAHWTRWRPWDWVGFAVLLAGALILFSAVMGSRNSEWSIATQHYKGRMVEYGLWAAGALTIGLGVFPVLVGLAAVVRPRREKRTPELRAFQAMFFASVFCVWLYTAVKAAYVSTVFSTLVEERNLIYLAPLFFAATALWLERRRVLPVALALAAGLTLSLILITPYQMEVRLYGDAFGLAILENANRVLSWTPTDAKIALLVIFAVSLLVVLAPLALGKGRRRIAGAIAGVAAVLVLAWNLTGEISASNASNAFSDEFLANLPPPLDWVDRAIGKQGFVYIGQNIGDANGLYLLEFWNRNLKQMWSLDATAKGPGPIITPDVLSRRGLLTQPPTSYVVVGPGVDVVGPVVARHPYRSAGAVQGWRLVRYTPPLRLSDSVTGIASDGWTTAPGPGVPATSAFTQYAGTKPGTATVVVSRQGWNGGGPPGHVTVVLGTVVLGADRYPHIGRVLQTRRFVLRNGTAQTVVLPHATPPFRIEVSISPTFVPQQLDPAHFSDARYLGAQVGYAFGPR